MAIKNSVMMFIDTSKCMGCKACQVACKQWHSLPVESPATTFTGTYTNPDDLSGTCLTYVRFVEDVDLRGRFQWLMGRIQCMHCNQAECQIHCPKGVKKSLEGFVVFNDDCTVANLRGVEGANNIEKIANYIALCPYNIPRWNGTRFVKCDFCVNRFGAACAAGCRDDGKPTTACEFTCAPGAIVTGKAKTIMQQAKERLFEVKVNLGYNNATLYGGRGRVLYLLTEEYSKFGLPYPD
jgi:formate dehydrogenase iron-sulfur subunit